MRVVYVPFVPPAVGAVVLSPVGYSRTLKVSFPLPIPSDPAMVCSGVPFMVVILKRPSPGRLSVAMVKEDLLAFSAAT